MTSILLSCTAYRAGKVCRSSFSTSAATIANAYAEAEENGWTYDSVGVLCCPQCTRHREKVEES